MKNGTKIIGLAVIVFLCLIAVFIGMVIHQSNNEEETAKRKTNSHYSDGGNKIDKMIAEISTDKKHISKKPDY